jgi:hypothetical protein
MAQAEWHVFTALHPAGQERPLVANHPEVLEIAARDKIKGVSLARVEATLGALPSPGPGYERSASPEREHAAQIICYECGGSGHVASECPLQAMEYEDDA